MFMFIPLKVGVCNVDGWTCLQIHTIRYRFVLCGIVLYPWLEAGLMISD